MKANVYVQDDADGVFLENVDDNGSASIRRWRHLGILNLDHDVMIDTSGDPDAVILLRPEKATSMCAKCRAER